MAVIMLTSITALLFTAAAFMVYDLVTYQHEMVRHLSTLTSLMAENSTAAITFQHDEDAQNLLAALHTEPHIVEAALYDDKGNLFVRYPTNHPASVFPAKPLPAGQYKEPGHLVFFRPVSEGDRAMGTVYIRADVGALQERLRLYAGIAGLVLVASGLVALGVSNSLQRRISTPILALANTARIISERQDYSVRAPKTSQDELGLLTDAFNQMLTRIQEQTVALRHGQERLRLALEASRTGTWDWNIKENRVDWDEHTHRLFGLEPGAFDSTYDHFLDLIHPQDRAAVTDSINLALERKAAFNMEFRVIWPDKSVHFLGVRGEALYDEAGSPVRMTGVALDITGRKQAEEIRSFLVAIVESSDDAIIGKDMTGTIVSWNSGAERMFGYSSAEMLGHPINKLVARDRPHEEPEILESIRRGETRHLETVRVRKDRQPIEVSLTVSPIRNDQGEIIGASSICRDITERRRAQVALETQAGVLREQAQMLDLANVMARDLEDHIILWNTGMEKMYGWAKNEALGKISHELLQTQFPQAPEQIRNELMAAGSWEGEVIHIGKAGQQLIVASQWVLHRDDQGQPAAVLEINNDITARKQAEDQILKLNLELEHRVQERTAELTSANRELEAFTYSVAHDLRAPLRHIDAFTKILHEDFAMSLPQEAQRYLENIRNGSQNMSRLVDDLLNLARVGRQELRRRPIPLGDLVRDVLLDLKGETQGRAIEWRIHSLPTIECDSGLMKQVFTNLLSNAVKYTRPRPLAVVEVGAREKNGDTAVFVRDNGVGFSMKYADKLFGVFQRLHRAEEFEGTGVGLATVERIVRRHGGSVWAEAAVGEGATFYFTVIPCSDGHEQVLEEKLMPDVSI